MLLGRGASSKPSRIFGSTPLPNMRTNNSIFVNNPSFFKFAVAKCSSSRKAKNQTKNQGDFGQVVFILSWLVLLPESLKRAK